MQDVFRPVLKRLWVHKGNTDIRVKFCNLQEDAVVLGLLFVNSSSESHELLKEVKTFCQCTKPSVKEICFVLVPTDGSLDVTKYSEAMQNWFTIENNDIHVLPLLWKFSVFAPAFIIVDKNFQVIDTDPLNTIRNKKRFVVVPDWNQAAQQNYKKPLPAKERIPLPKLKLSKVNQFSKDSTQVFKEASYVMFYFFQQSSLDDQLHEKCMYLLRRNYIDENRCRLVVVPLERNSPESNSWDGSSANPMSFLRDEWWFVRHTEPEIRDLIRKFDVENSNLLVLFNLEKSTWRDYFPSTLTDFVDNNNVGESQFSSGSPHFSVSANASPRSAESLRQEDFERRVEEKFYSNGSYSSDSENGDARLPAGRDTSEPGSRERENSVVVEENADRSQQSDEGEDVANEAQNLTFNADEDNESLSVDSVDIGIDHEEDQRSEDIQEVEGQQSDVVPDIGAEVLVGENQRDAMNRIRLAFYGLDQVNPSADCDAQMVDGRRSPIANDEHESSASSVPSANNASLENSRDNELVKEEFNPNSADDVRQLEAFYIMIRRLFEEFDDTANEELFIESALQLWSELSFLLKDTHFSELTNIIIEQSLQSATKSRLCARFVRAKINENPTADMVNEGSSLREVVEVKICIAFKRLYKLPNSSAVRAMYHFNSTGVIKDSSVLRALHYVYTKAQNNHFVAPYDEGLLNALQMMQLTAPRLMTNAVVGECSKKFIQHMLKRLPLQLLPPRLMVCVSELIRYSRNGWRPVIAVFGGENSDVTIVTQFRVISVKRVVLSVFSQKLQDFITSNRPLDVAQALCLQQILEILHNQRISDESFLECGNPAFVVGFTEQCTALLNMGRQLDLPGIEAYISRAILAHKCPGDCHRCVARAAFAIHQNLRDIKDKMKFSAVAWRKFAARGECSRFHPQMGVVRDVLAAISP